MKIDLDPIRGKLSETLSLLGPEIGFHFLDQIQKLGASGVFDLLASEDVSTGQTSDGSGGLVLRFETSRDFEAALSALRTGDLTSFLGHLQMTPDPLLGDALRAYGKRNGPARESRDGSSFPLGGR